VKTIAPMSIPAPRPLRALEVNKALDLTPLRHVEDSERVARQRADSPKRRADRKQGELSRLVASISTELLRAVRREALERDCSLSHVVEEALLAHVRKRVRGEGAR
jgi:hypothetical protein